MTPQTRLVLSLTRTFKAAPPAVFDAFSRYEAMAAWFGPETCRVASGSVDFRVGGAYRLVMETPRGEAVIAGRYLEIEPHARLAFTWQWQDDEDWTDCDSHVVIEFRPVPDGTELTLTHTGFPTEESLGNHRHGWNGSFDKLQA